jgi:hypothetical protein
MGLYEQNHEHEDIDKDTLIKPAWCSACFRFMDSEFIYFLS